MSQDTVVPEHGVASGLHVPTRRSPFGALLLLLAALAVGAYLYWRFIYLPTTPQYALDRFFDAAKAKDYNRIYEMVQVPPPLKVLVRSGAELKALADRAPGLVPEVQNHRYGEVKVDGERATVETTTVALQNGSPVTGTTWIRLVRTAGIWRIDGDWILAEAARRGMGGLLLGGPD